MSRERELTNFATFDHHDTLAYSELDAVTGGYWNLGRFFSVFFGIPQIPQPTANVTVNGGPSAFVAPLVPPS
jgi:hypothetical protein